MTTLPREFNLETVFQGKKFAVERSSLEFPNGKTTTFEAVRHPGAVVIVPRLPSGDFGVIRQYRHALKASILEFPAGTLEAGEAPSVCASREIVEEIGHRAGSLVDLGVLYPAPGFCDEQQHLFFASDLSPAFAPGDDDEVIDLAPMSRQAIEDAIAAGEFNDAKSIAAFTRAALRGLL